MGEWTRRAFIGTGALVGGGFVMAPHDAGAGGNGPAPRDAGAGAHGKEARHG